MSNDHHGLVVNLLAATPGDVGAGNEHGRIVGMFVLTAYFRIVVVDVFQNIAQADPLGMTDDAHLVHGGQFVFKLAFDEKEKIFQRFYAFVRVLDRSARNTLP